METPRTDEQEDRCNNCGIRFVDRDFARQLERELSAALAAKERLEEVVRDAIELHRHATFDNGVEDNAGHKEADYWAAQWDEQARAALAGKEVAAGSGGQPSLSSASQKAPTAEHCPAAAQSARKSVGWLSTYGYRTIVSEVLRSAEPASPEHPTGAGRDVPELLPCPFCGNRLTVIEAPRRRSTNTGSAVYVHPTKGDCPLAFGLQVSRGSIGAWNRRAAPSEER